MKPPARQRAPLKPFQAIEKIKCKWTLKEKEKLLQGMKRLGTTDYLNLQICVPTHSVEEVEQFLNERRAKQAVSSILKLSAVKTPIEEWIDMVQDLLTHTTELSFLLGNLMEICEKFETRPSPSDPDVPDYSRLYGYLSALLQGKDPPKLSRVEAGVILELFQHLADRLNSLKLTDQRRLMQLKYTLLRRSMNMSNETLAHSLIGTALQKDPLQVERQMKEKELMQTTERQSATSEAVSNQSHVGQGPTAIQPASSMESSSSMMGNDSLSVPSTSLAAASQGNEQSSPKEDDVSSVTDPPAHDKQQSVESVNHVPDTSAQASAPCDQRQSVARTSEFEDKPGPSQAGGRSSTAAAGPSQKPNTADTKAADYSDPRPKETALFSLNPLCIPIKYLNPQQLTHLLPTWPQPHRPPTQSLTHRKKTDVSARQPELDRVRTPDLAQTCTVTGTFPSVNIVNLPDSDEGIIRVHGPVDFHGPDDLPPSVSGHTLDEEATRTVSQHAPLVHHCSEESFHNNPTPTATVVNAAELIDIGQPVNTPGGIILPTPPDGSGCQRWDIRLQHGNITESRSPEELMNMGPSTVILSAETATPHVVYGPNPDDARSHTEIAFSNTEDEQSATYSTPPPLTRSSHTPSTVIICPTTNEFHHREISSHTMDKDYSETVSSNKLTDVESDQMMHTPGSDPTYSPSSSDNVSSSPSPCKTRVHRAGLKRQHDTAADVHSLPSREREQVEHSAVQQVTCSTTPSTIIILPNTGNASHRMQDFSVDQRSAEGSASDEDIDAHTHRKLNVGHPPTADASIPSTIVILPTESDDQHWDVKVEYDTENELSDELSDMDADEYENESTEICVVRTDSSS